MQEKLIKALSVTVLFVYGIAAWLLALNSQSVVWRFPLAFFPLFVILFGVAILRLSGLTMAIVGLAITILLAVFMFGTPFEVTVGASAVGFLKSLGISISVTATMLLIFLMRETGALQTVSRVIKQQVVGSETTALYIGIGFGSFLSSLGVVTPALFPPLLMSMGFSPAASIAIAVLGYDPTTSFSLLSIPITLPADQSAKILVTSSINPVTLAFKIAIFLPLISVGFALAILWLVGGRSSMKKGLVPALVSGITLGTTCLISVSIDYFSGFEIVPLRIVGVIAGLCAMGSLYIYQKLRHLKAGLPKQADYPSRRRTLQAFSPWIILSLIALVVGIPQVGSWLAGVPGNLEILHVFADQKVDLDVLYQIYTWIFVVVLVSIFTLQASRKQTFAALKAWAKRFASPFLAYSLYFCIAYVMAWSAMRIFNESLAQSEAYAQLNMNNILGTTLASVFGAGYIFVAASLGLFGAVVGGSETSSNILFMKVQKTAADNVGLSDAGFMTVYGSHAVAGGIASAVTPAKINNAAVTIDESPRIESMIMRRHMVIAILLTIATGILTAIFVNIGL